MVQLRDDGCLVMSGRWIDPYTKVEYFDASEVDIDHLIPLKFTWLYGANLWSKRKLRSFYNDPTNLVIVGKIINREKGALGPLDWLPPNIEIHCEYITKFIDVSRNYGLIYPENKSLGYAQIKNQVC